MYDKYFPVTRFLGLPWYGGYLGAEAGETDRLYKNNYELFSAGGLDFLVIHIELDWPDYAVTWADKIVKRYPNRRVILSSHAFLNTSNARPTAAQFRTNGTSAEQVWQRIIKPNCNVFMVVNGHYPGEGRRTDLNDCGKPVHQVLMDYQSRANGGDGWLRYFVFKPSENKIYGYTYSVTRLDFETDDSSQFVLDYNMQGTPFAVIGTNTNVASGSTTSTTWTGLTPGPDYGGLPTVNDGKATTTGPTAAFTASVASANTPPSALPDAYTTAQGAPLTVPAPGVLANDTDADDNALTVSLTQNPLHGTVSLNSFGGFTYTPAAGYSGPDSFSYAASDGIATSIPAVVTITVTAAPNHAPVAGNDSASTLEDAPVAIAVLSNDSDSDSDTLSVATLGSAAHGVVSVNTDGVVLYAPVLNFNGTDSFTYTISDGRGGSSTATVSVTISAVNDAPTAGNDVATTAEETPVSIAVLVNDTDPDSDLLTVSSVSVPGHGTAAISADGTIRYTP